MLDPRFGFDPYHILLVALGASLLLSYWLPHLFIRRPPAATALLMACGMAGSLLFPGIVSGIDPTVNPLIWEVSAELVVIVVLFATGLRIDVVALYGVRGNGSLYYLGYASTHVEFIDEGQLWAVVAFTIFASTVIHGLTAAVTVEALDREASEGRG
jgi:NhaP-type Na+/H+ or K+/H+ antiporter